MKKIVLIVFSTLAFGIVYSQNCGGGSSSGTGSIGSASPSVGNFNYQSANNSVMASLASNVRANQYLSSVAQYDEIDGSPYLTKEAVSGTLVMNDGNEIKNIPIKYDLYVGEIIATNEEGEDIVLDSRYYQEIYFDHEGEMLSFKKVNRKNPDRFYEVIYESGDIVFFKDENVKLRKGENLGVTSTKPNFSKSKKYYVSGSDGSLAKVNLKKRDVFDHFPELEAVAFREYIKSAKIKLSKEKDYKKLFASMDD